MTRSTNISWAEKTWNPITGCTKVSPGCKHCYAETFAERWRGVPGNAYAQGFDLRLAPHKLHEPLTWTQPRMVFVNSMSDLYHERIPTAYIEAVHRVMTMANWHTYQVLTKRPDRIGNWVLERLDAPHIWLGVSVEDRKYGIPRIEYLRRATAGVRFLSIEPLLEDLGEIDLRGIDWVIVGGESGAGARPMREEWVLNIKRQCDESGAAFFFKQWGGVNKKLAGRTLLGRTWDAMPTPLLHPIPPHGERLVMAVAAKAMARSWADHPLAWRAS